MAKKNVSDIIKNLIKVSGNELASVVEDGTVSDIVDYIDTGSYRLNAQMAGDIYKGCPTNRIIGLGGGEASLKSYICIEIAKHFLEDNPDGIVYFHETENSNNKDVFESRNMDTSRIVFAPIATIEDYKNEMTVLLNDLNKHKVGEAPKVLFILDSYGNLQTEKTMVDAEKGNTKVDFTKSKVSGGAFGIISNKLLKHKYTLLITNHIYDDVGSFMNITHFSGGRKFRYICTILFKQTTRQLKVGDEIVGAIVKVKTEKSRLTVPKKQTELLLSFKKGIYKYSGLFDDCIDAGIWIKSGDNVITNLQDIETFNTIKRRKMLKKVSPIKDLDKTAEILTDLAIESGIWGTNKDKVIPDMIMSKLFDYTTNMVNLKNEYGEVLPKEQKKIYNDIEKHIEILIKEYKEDFVYDEKEVLKLGVEKVMVQADPKDFFNEQTLESLTNYIKEELIKIDKKLGITEDMKVKDANDHIKATEEKIKESGRTKKEIETNPKKHFTKDILDKLNVYLKELFCYGSDLEKEQAQANKEG
jgi:RecA/RadA recombinase